MFITCEYVGPWDNSYPLYRADDRITGFHAYGTSHWIAIKNVLDTIHLWREDIANKQN